MERLNYFNPYQSKGAWHEDQLTRAFLVAARMVPLVLSVLLDFIREEQVARGPEMKLPSTTELLANVEILTQQTTVPQTTGRLISVVMTDETWTPEGDVMASDRGARYDGVLSFDPLWIVVIENKPSSNDIWEKQVHPNLPAVHEIEIDKKAIVLYWRKVVERLTTLVSANVLHGAERMIVDDCLQFVDEDFPYLNPYDSFGQCKTSRQLLQRRCRAVLEAAAPGRVEWQPKWGTHYILLNQPFPVKMCGLYPSKGDVVDQIELAIYPGDTMAQARAFFAYLSRHGTDRLLALKGRGWKISPNFHFGFIQRGFGHGVNTTLSLEEYIRYWAEHPIKQVSLAEQKFDEALQTFVSTGMINIDDINKVAIQLPVSAQAFNVIPGVALLFQWPLSKAIEIDQRKGMVEEFTRVANEGISVCGGSLWE